MSPVSRRALAFYETMPDRYRQLFQGPTVGEHAAIAARRGGAPAHAEIWRRLPNGGAIACLVAEDRPGLLSYIGTVFMTRSIDILSAQLYSRADPRGAEVVDLFWLGREDETAAAIAPIDLARVADLLSGLMTGALRMGGRPLAARHAASQASATLVRLEEVPEGGLATLTLETVERPGLFPAVTSALVDANVRIISSKRASAQASRVIHRFSIAEQDGRAPDQYRRGFLQAEVLRVVERVTQRASTAPSDAPPSSLEEAPGRHTGNEGFRPLEGLANKVLPAECKTTLPDAKLLAGELANARHELVSVAPADASPQPSAAEARSPRALVLVVEDARDDREFLATELRSAGFAVLEAPDADTAIDQATRVRPEAMIVDLVLPGASGFQVARVVRADERTKHIAILAISRLSSEYRRLALHAGCDAFFRKPVDGSAVVSELSRLVRSSMR
jgi:CheY-like chemotaxis protein